MPFVVQLFLLLDFLSGACSKQQAPSKQLPLLKPYQSQNWIILYCFGLIHSVAPNGFLSSITFQTLMFLERNSLAFPSSHVVVFFFSSLKAQQKNEIPENANKCTKIRDSDCAIYKLMTMTLFQNLLRCLAIYCLHRQLSSQAAS